MTHRPQACFSSAPSALMARNLKETTDLPSTTVADTYHVLKHSVDSVASYSSQNHVDRIRTQNFSAASCQDEGDFSSIKTCLFRRSSSNSGSPNKRPESVISNTSSTRSRLRELVERKSSQDEQKPAANTVGDIQYFQNPTETLEFDSRRSTLDSRTSQEDRPKKRKLSKNKDKDLCENKIKKHEKYHSKLAEYYKLPIQLPQDEFYQHLTRSKAAEELLHKRFSNSDTEFNGSYGRLCKHKEPEGSNLRRSRSLAVIREETFSDLQIQNHSKAKRSQLIPRARLFDKPCFKDRLPSRAKYKSKEEVFEGIYIESTASCFGDINRQREKESSQENLDEKSDKEDVALKNESNRSRSVSGSRHNLDEDQKQTNISEDSVGHSRNASEIDSLDSNYVRKHYNFEAHCKNYKESSPESERSTSDKSKTQFYSTTDDLDTDNEEKNRSKNYTPKSFTNDSLSITQSDKENADVSEVDGPREVECYDEISLNSKSNDQKDLKVETNTKSETKIEDSQSTVSENDGSISSPPDSITSYISISIASSTDKSHKLEYLANSLAEKIDEYCESHFKEDVSSTSSINHSENTNPESDTIYTQLSKKRTFADIKRDSIKTRSSNNSLFNEFTTSQPKDVYVSNTYIEGIDYSRHNETSKNITTEPFVTTLIENQYYSLPDLNISKCLRKSEKIDAQLRQEDPEEILGENTYEVAQSHFREILSSKGSDNYGQLTKGQLNGIPSTASIYVPVYSEPQIQNLSKLEDDLKSIITVESSEGDDSEYYRSNAHQNERELNEIEGTIRNNKLISKTASLNLSSASNYQPKFNISKSYSNDNIRKKSTNNSQTGIKKHYSLRQRDPIDDEITRLPSPKTAERNHNRIAPTIQSYKEDNKQSSLLSRVQSFKTSAESNISIVPLSGHQTIVINPPLVKEQKRNITISPELPVILNVKNETVTVSCPPYINENKEKELRPSIDPNRVDTSKYCTTEDSFITIKLNKVVKTNIPKLKNSCEKIANVQYRFEKPPPRLIIKDNNQSLSEIEIPTITKQHKSMPRPQILQVTNSKSEKPNISVNTEKNKDKSMAVNFGSVNTNSDVKPEIKECKSENVKEKLQDAIKTDIEYQEKLHSVKNYWSKLIDKSPEIKEEKETVPDNSTPAADDVCDKEDNSSLPDISVGSIIKSLENVKIVDSIRKMSNAKLNLWKDETEKLKSETEIEETTVKKIIKDKEENIYEKNKKERVPKPGDCGIFRETPEIEIVELGSDDNQNQKTQATLIKPKGFDKDCDDFDHVRYKVMKSELFKNSMIANYRKEAQFDGLLQYLQDYSFQELLVNNNIVIIEPVRTKIEPIPKKSSTETCKIPPSLLQKSENGSKPKSKSPIRRHFFYHPIRVNKEIIEEELPNPDTVKKVRNLFEETLKMRSPVSTHDPPLIDESVGLTRRATSYRNIDEEIKVDKVVGRRKVLRQLTIDTNFVNKKWDNASLSSGVSSGDLSSNNEYETDGLSPYSQKNLKDNVYCSSDEYLCESVNQDFCCESQYVSPDILRKIRECGTSVTYYGGKIMNSKTGSVVSPMTKAIMEEIKGLQKNCSRDCYSCQTKCRGEKCSCLLATKHKSETQISTTSSDSGNQDCDKNKITESFPGFKFKLVKSNSCSSRLELTGTDENSRFKFRQFSRADDPPLVCEGENSVKNRIYRLESYNKGIVKTPFETKDNEVEKNTTDPKTTETVAFTKDVSKQDHVEVSKRSEESKDYTQGPMDVSRKNSDQTDKQAADNHSFEKKFYYVNDNLDQNKVTTGKFGEMVFEEFEVLETSYDSLNSNKSLK